LFLGWSEKHIIIASLLIEAQGSGAEIWIKLYCIEQDNVVDCKPEIQLSFFHKAQFKMPSDAKDGLKIADDAHVRVTVLHHNKLLHPLI
jgi:hypothetical protein